MLLAAPKSKTKRVGRRRWMGGRIPWERQVASLKMMVLRNVAQMQRAEQTRPLKGDHGAPLGWRLEE
jgi:hypothetical protein